MKSDKNLSAKQNGKTLILGQPNAPLTPEQIVMVAEENLQVELSPSAIDQIKAGHNVVMQAMRNNQPVYGLTVGVGLNKDQAVFSSDRKFDLLMEESRKHNEASLRAHAAVVGNPLPESVVRAAMLIRLNMMITGASGVSPDVALQMLAFINNRITPVVPDMGSVGQADINQNAHIGLALTGEWDVFYQGKRMPSDMAMEEAGLTPVSLIGKDFLTIVSSNYLTAARIALSINRTSHFIKCLYSLSALALEGLNGNLAPFMPHVVSARPYPGVNKAAKKLLNLMEGSSLFKKDEKRPLQDPLSFRGIAYNIGQLVETYEQAFETLSIHINHPDDNPLVIAGGEENSEYSDYNAQHLVKDESGKIVGGIYPSANYEGQPLAIITEHLSSALARISNMLTAQLVKTESPQLTGLPRFLKHPDNNGHAFGALQKPMFALDKANQMLAGLVSIGHSPMAGGIEDMASFVMQGAENLEKIINNIYQMASLHLLHFAQAVDLRKDFTQGPFTRRFLSEYREYVPLVTHDRVFTLDIQAGVIFLNKWQPEEI